MEPFTYIATDTASQALTDRASTPDAAFVAGGTSLLDLMKLGVEHPGKLVDINALPLGNIDALPDGGFRIGAMVRNSTLAYHPGIAKAYPALAQAILSGASPQLRNMATTGGNLLQRTRCYYFRNVTYPCNKRSPGSGCYALNAFNRNHAILGASDQCIATHPSDMCVALAAIDATIRLQGPSGERTVPLNEFYIPYGQDPAKENVLMPGELITAVDLPALSFFARSLYLKMRDRTEYEFSLSSVAVALDIDGGAIKQARLALGGVATKPWRASAAEKTLIGAKPSDDVFLAAANAELNSAVARQHNGFKIELCRQTIIRALQSASAQA